MLSHYVRIICVALYLVISAAIAQAELPQISSGLSYLASSQNPDSTWHTSTSEVETTAATVSVLDTLKVLNQTAGTPYTTGTAWLQAQTPQTVDYIAQRMRILGLTDAAQLVPVRDTHTGAWGGDAGYETDILDTALALQALNSANYPDATIINPALAYLTTSQNTDGGWGFYKGDDSNVYMTAVVSTTLQQFPQMATIATAVSNATAFLLTHQNTDGGFGSSPSTVYETALAYAALAAVSTDATILGNATNYLTATQSTNGSWNDDPYSTALALKALYLAENKPAPPPPPPAGGKITGAVVDAATNQRLAGVSVVLGSNDLIRTTSDSMGSFILSDIPPGSQSVNFSLAGYAAKFLSAAVVENTTFNLGNVPMLSSYSTGTIAGTVTDPAGKPLAGVAITVTGTWSGTATTGADGAFSFTYVTPGQVTISAAKAAYETVTGSGTVYARTTLSFSPRMSTTPPQVTTGMLVGRVVVETPWGLRPVDHLPEEAGVTVTLSGGISVEVEADNGGYFTISGLASNTYQVIVGKSGLIGNTYRAVIMPGATTDLGTIVLKMSVSIMTLSGKITDASTGAPIPGAEVTVSGHDIAGRADFSGMYAIADIPNPGTYTVKASATGYIGKSFTLRSSPWLQTMNISLSPRITTGLLTGRIVDASSGEPLTGVTLTLAGNPAITVTTDTAGAFTLAAIPEGAQQITVELSGYVPRTVTAVITAGATTDGGMIPLSATPLPAAIRGIVRDATAGLPFAGIEMTATGAGTLKSVTATDGTYLFDTVEPGSVTVATTAVPKPGYATARITANLLPGGLLIFNPSLPKTMSGSVGIAVQPGKSVYRVGETVAMLVTLHNNETDASSVSMHVRVSDPAGGTAYVADVPVHLEAEGNSEQPLTFALPTSAPAGRYLISAEVFALNGALINRAATEFGAAVSEIAVTPLLPVLFSGGSNTVSFNLTNSGLIPVSAGVFEVVLTDPDGQTVSAGSQDFSLNTSESKALSCSVVVPALKFGAYILSYRQSDETTSGRMVEIPLQNSIGITALFDRSSYRIRESASLSVTVTNTGRFTMDSNPGIAVTAAVPNAAYSETKTVSAPAVGTGGSVSKFSFSIPETVLAGQHPTRVTVTLPSGSTQSHVTYLAIPDSMLTVAPLQQTTHSAGGTISPVVSNSGGIDTTVQYILRLFDAKAALIAEKSNSETILAASTLPLTLPIPVGAVDGSYSLVMDYKDIQTGKEGVFHTPLSISGVKATLSVKTGKDTYFLTENITGLGTITNTGTVLNGGDTHLQVSTGPGSMKQKTWTTQADFQTGVRNGVDTYGVNDWIIPDDDFETSTIDQNRWWKYGNVVISSGKALFGGVAADSLLWGKLQFEGDFDIQVDFSANNAIYDLGAQLAIASGSNGWFFIYNCSFGYVSGASVDGQQLGRVVTGAHTPSGRLRITRTGSTMAAFYWSGSSWIEAYRVAHAQLSNPGAAVIGVGGRVNAIPSTEYDNFKVYSGRIKTVSQTVDSVRLLPLSDNFDDGIVNEDRWKYDCLPKTTESSGSMHLQAVVGAPCNQIALKSSIPGDFIATSKFSNFSAAPAGVRNGGFMMHAVAGSTGFYITRESDETWRAGGNFIAGLSHINGYYLMDPITSYTSASGSFRLVRVGSTGFDQYWNGSGWTTVHSRNSISTEPAVMRFNTHINETLQSLKADVDLFYTNKGTYAGTGTLNLKYDSHRSGSWDRVFYTADKPTGSLMQFRTRSSETEEGLANAVWSDYFTASGTPITSPSARWIEIEATLSTTDPNMTPLLHDVTVTYLAEQGEILWQTDVPANIEPAASAQLNNTIGTLGATGKLYFQGDLTSSTGQSIASAEYPFYIQQGNFQLLLSPDKRLYRPGETVTISGEARNLTTIDAAGLVLQVKENAGGLLLERTIDLPANGSHPFTISTTAGTDGSYSLTGILSQNSTTIATAQDQYETASPVLAATLTAPDNVGTAPFDVLLSITNSGKVETVTSVTLSDENGTIGTQSVAVPAGETRMLQYNRQITGTMTYEAVFTGDLSQTLAKMVTFTPTQLDRSITGNIVADKISYNPNEQVTLTANVTSVLAEENLSATVTIIDVNGHVPYSTTAPIPLMIQGQTITSKNYWNTGTNVPGAYLVQLRIVDAAGNILSTSTCTLLINSTTKPTALLKGAISVDKQSLLTGEPVTVSYGITNTGNVDLSDIALTIQTVNLSEQIVYNTISGQTALVMGATYSSSGTVATDGYTAKDYLVVLRAAINGIEDTLAGTYFRVEGAPSVPALVAPTTGTDVETPTPALVVNNAADPNDDRLIYEFEVYSDSGLNNLVSSGTVPETAAMTAWPVANQLIENQTCYWRARAYDGRLYGDWMPTASFRVNVANDPPTAPTIASPADTTTVDTLSPVLAVNNASDPDSASLTYNFQLASDTEFLGIITSTTGVFGGEGTTSWQLQQPLAENTWYYWHAQADDWFIEGPWSATASFFVNTLNDAPTVPAITTPAENATVTTLSVGITAVNSIDPDSSGLLYFFEADTSPAFDSAGVIRSGGVPEGSGMTSWVAEGLSDNSRYYLRVKASDGIADSPWSGQRSFVANTANDPPTTPVLANPSNGAGVNQSIPVLSVHNATDLDHDPLTYEFELYDDPAGTNVIAHMQGIAETGQITSWTVPEPLTENLTYHWRVRASDGALNSDWSPLASFMINAVNDAPGAPVLSSPAPGSSVATLTPRVAVENAFDPDSDSLTYDFEIYNGSSIAASASGIPENGSSTTAWTVGSPLAGNMAYQWRARAYDGDVYGPWTSMADFTVHLPATSISATINFDPDTLNRASNGTWVVVYIELPAGHQPTAINVSTIRLEGTIPAEAKPYAIGDHDKDGIPDLMVKFRRSEAVRSLVNDEEVPVHVTGKAGDLTFEGVDVIRVIER